VADLITENCPSQLKTRLKTNYLAESLSGSEEGSKLRPIDLYHSTLGSRVIKKNKKVEG
jgi:hypothetical protein